ncbi:PAP_fibrillin [Xenococcus sp. PCC 7305]|uniref:PAP/fibrillin family protein n=1 Tax=Xenococcus sp. PCC 7305 TaxID=102125 RepID=UPI0002ACDF21|nr:PAP/fibrillin family protein [Xenococcus sp. PCC 7305]ELS05612.1 PAP_fibrillin [Xenococcus sp. PCC 7305]
MQTDSSVGQREQAKADLIKALADHDGDTKQVAVVDAIAKLAALNPTSRPVEHQELLQGNWLLINAPNFPDRLEDEANRYVYTLGRLAFNKFEPVNLRVAIEQVSQPVFATGQENEYTHDIIVEFEIIEPGFPQLKGIVKNLAVCTPVDEDTVQVKFTGGELMPLDNQDPELRKQWQEIFGDSQKVSRVSLLDRLKFWFVQTMFGMGQVSAIDSVTGIKHFEIKKSPKGLLKLIYLDDELRITKGNRETVLVCQRQVY